MVSGMCRPELSFPPFLIFPHKLHSHFVDKKKLHYQRQTGFIERSVVMDGTQKRKGSPDASSSAKRSRNDDGNSGSQGGGFEEELAALDFVNDKNPSAKWSRPAVPKLNPLTDDIVFQQLEVDNYIGLYTLALTSFMYFLDQ